MKTTAGFTAVLLLSCAPAGAHRLDEYLQATLISVERNQIHTQLRLVPGVMVLPTILRSIDSDADGVISETEQRAYAGRVLHDLSLTVDGERLPLRLVAMKFPQLEAMQQGLGEVQLEFDADIRNGGRSRKLVFENHHQRLICAYLVNCLVPRDSDIRITAQNRNYEQSSYGVEYTQTPVRRVLPIRSWLSGGSAWVSAVVLLLFARLVFLWRRALPDRAFKTIL
jgi:hypothetical protein